MALKAKKKPPAPRKAKAIAKALKAKKAALKGVHSHKKRSSCHCLLVAQDTIEQALKKLSDTDVEKKAYVRLAPDDDAMDVANKIGIIYTDYPKSHKEEPAISVVLRFMVLFCSGISCLASFLSPFFNQLNRSIWVVSEHSPTGLQIICVCCTLNEFTDEPLSLEEVKAGVKRYANIKQRLKKQQPKSWKTKVKGPGSARQRHLCEMISFPSGSY
ncbi:hypothetical protein P7K49_013545, partial [Saguinus oedipus]